MRYVASAVLSILIAGQSLSAPAPKKGKPKAKPAAAAPEAPAPAPAPAPEADASAPAPAVAHTGAHAEAVAYGVAGCGLGSLLIKDKGKVSQILASLLNGTGMQSLAVTSGTSNCAAGGNAVALEEQKLYMASNLSSLGKEAAQGEGDYLAGLAEVLGCRSDSGRARLNRVSQEKYHEIFAVQEPREVLQQYKAAIAADPLLQEQCVTAI